MEGGKDREERDRKEHLLWLYLYTRLKERDRDEKREKRGGGVEESHGCWGVCGTFQPRWRPVLLPWQQ